MHTMLAHVLELTTLRQETRLVYALVYARSNGSGRVEIPEDELLIALGISSATLRRYRSELADAGVFASSLRGGVLSCELVSGAAGSDASDAADGNAHGVRAEDEAVAAENAHGVRGEGKNAHGVRAEDEAAAAENAHGVRGEGKNAHGVRAEDRAAAAENAHGVRGEGENAHGVRGEGENAHGVRGDEAKRAWGARQADPPHTPPMSVCLSVNDNKQTDREGGVGETNAPDGVWAGDLLQDGEPADGAEMARTLRLLLDEQVGMGEPQARELAGQHRFWWTLANVLTWRRQLEARKVRNVGALLQRLRMGWAPEGIGVADRESALFRRHVGAAELAELHAADLAAQRAAERARIMTLYAPSSAVNATAFTAPTLSDDERRCKELWDRTRNHLRLQLPRSTYETWIRDTECLGQTDGEFVIGVMNAYAKDWLELRLRPLITRTVASVTQIAQPTLKFVVREA